MRDSRTLAGLKSCYERSVKRNPTLAGRVRFHMTLDGSKVSVRVIENTLAEPYLAVCLTKKLRAALARHRPPPGRCSFQWSIVFAPR